MLKQWELHWGSVLEEHHVGKEQYNKLHKPRPWLILSDGRTQRRKLVIACPTTTNMDPQNVPFFRMYLKPDEVIYAPGDKPLKRDCQLLFEQLRAMSLERFAPPEGSGTSRIGKLKPVAQAQAELRLREVLNLD